MLVNHPTVLVTSIPSPTSSRPCPSTSTNNLLLPLHLPYPLANPVNSTSCICVLYASGASFISFLVSSTPILTSTIPLLPLPSLSLPPLSLPSLLASSPSSLTLLQYPTSSFISLLPHNLLSPSPHLR